MEPPEIWAKEPDLEMLESVIVLVGNDPRRAVEEFKSLADRGSVGSLLWLGSIFEGGDGIPADISRSEEYYQRALEAGSRDAAFNLGRLYRIAKDESRRNVFGRSD